MYIVRQLSSTIDIADACVSGILRQWDELLSADEFATLYQGREWSMAWFNSYADEFDPLVLTVSLDNELVGVVALCVERRNRHIHFAGLTFSDYRDVLARAEHRESVLRILLEYYRDSHAPNVFRIGPMSPGSTSARLLPTLLTATGTRGISRSHSGWRYLASRASPETQPMRSKTLKYNYNWYRRNGGSIDVEVIEEREQWHDLMPIFLEQHSLRQLSAGRRVSFNDPRKVDLFDRMFDATCSHFCVLRANGRVIATHFGFRTGRLLHWGAPAFDIREAARSPSLLLVAILMMNLDHWRFDGLDLTIGEGFLKERFSNTKVTLPSVDLFPTAVSYSAEQVRSRMASTIKSRPSLLRLATALKTTALRARHSIQSHGIGGSLALLGRITARTVGEYSVGLVLTVTPDTFLPSARLPDEQKVEHGINAFEDLLRWQGDDAMTSYMIGHIAENILANIKTGRTLHTLVLDGKLACLGFSYLPTAPAVLTETGNLEFDFEPGSASLYAFYTIPSFRGRGLYQQLLTRILSWHFDQGVSLAYISVLESNHASRRAIERLGFRPRQRNRVARLGPIRRVTRVDMP